MTCTCKSPRRLPRLRKEQRLRSASVFVRSFRPLVNTSSDLRLNVPKKRNAWRKSSSAS